MKKFFYVLASVMLFSIGTSSAQEVGVRFGDAIGGEVAIDVVTSIGQFSRIHGDISFGNGLGVEALYDFYHQPLEHAGFAWYIGAGPYMFIGDPFQFGVSGEIGIEYHFSIPMAIGIDWRPSLRIIDDTKFIWDGFGLNVRYVFNHSE